MSTWDGKLDKWDSACPTPIQFFEFGLLLLSPLLFFLCSLISCVDGEFWSFVVKDGCW